MINKKLTLKAVFLLLLLFGCAAVRAQTTAFTYQGKLTENSATANGTYDMQFRLFDTQAAGTGTQQGSTVTNPTVLATNGIFTVNLDFGAAVFNGADRYLEVSIRPAGNSGGYTSLAPRQQITSTPYSVHSLRATNADNLGGAAATQFVQTTDSRLSNARSPLPGSANYIQNQTAIEQFADFKINGTGRANILDATQYNFAGFRVLSALGANNIFVGINVGEANTGSRNAFVGRDTGASNTTGTANSFFGVYAGRSNTTGGGNSFFGLTSGERNTTGGVNSFFGAEAGISNSEGFGNSFFGSKAGYQNTVGNYNSSFGYAAGSDNTSGNDNSFFGNVAGTNNTTGNRNVLLGYRAGSINTIGSNNTIIGASADVGTNNLIYATAVGAGSLVSSSNTIALGRTEDTVRVPGELAIINLAENGSTSLCRTAFSLKVATCSSSLRYKTNIQPFSFGLNLVNRLKPITFDWKEGGMSDLGLGAEDVAEIEPLLVTYNKDGKVEGVKYDRIGVVLLNAVKEQQTQIEAQQRQINELKQIVCALKPDTAICRETNK